MATTAAGQRRPDASQFGCDLLHGRLVDLTLPGFLFLAILQDLRPLRVPPAISVSPPKNPMSGDLTDNWNVGDGYSYVCGNWIQDAFGGQLEEYQAVAPTADDPVSIRTGDRRISRTDTAAADPVNVGGNPGTGGPEPTLTAGGN